MAVKIGSARIDENGKTYGGKAGDQTGKEVWRDVIGYEGIYIVSNLGNIISLPRFNCRGERIQGRLRKQSVDSSTGYSFISACDGNGNRTTLKTHRAVAEAFLPHEDGKNYVNHKDGNKLNNNASNLEWCTCSENVSHAIKTGLMQDHFYAWCGEANKNAKLTDLQVAEVKELYQKGIMKSSALAKKFGISKGHVCKIVKSEIRKKESGIYGKRVCG